MFLFYQKWTKHSGFQTKYNYEKFEQFSARAKHTLENIPTKYIDKTIESMPKRMLMVIKSKKGKVVKLIVLRVLRVKLKAKFDLYRFIPPKAVGSEIPQLDLVQNTLLILLCSVYLT